MRWRLFSFAAALAVIIGCGGGGTGVPSGIEPPMTVSNGSIQVKGTNLITSIAADSSATVYGVAGDLSSAVYRDLSPTDEESEIFYCSRSGFGSWQLKAFSVLDGSVRFIRDLVGTPGEMRINPSGTAAYISLQVAGEYKLYRYPLNGGSRTLIHSDCKSFAFTPSGSRIAYLSFTVPDGVWSMDALGGNRVKFAPTNFYDRVIGCPDEGTVRLADSTTSVAIGDHGINGNNAVTQSNSGMTLIDAACPTAGGPMWGIKWESGVPYLIRTSQRTIGAANCTVHNTAAYLNNGIDLFPSPSGRKVVVTTNGSSIGTISDGTSNTIQFQEQQLNQVAWGPYILQRELVGFSEFPGGAAAILYSETGDRMPAVVVADAVTRSSALLTKVSAAGSSNVVFRLDCDNLSRVSYAENASYTYTDVFTVPSGNQGAFISFNATSGRVASISVFSGTPNVVATPQGVTITGDVKEMVAPKGRPLNVSGRIQL